MAEAARAEKLMQEGFEQLRGGQLRAAERSAKKLIGLRHSSGFELLALVCADRGEPEKAVGILEEGVAKAPTVWLLWQLLGNLRSDLARYAGAEEAYRAALRCAGVDRASVVLNLSILLQRQGKPEEALAALRAVESEDPDLSLRLVTMRLSLLDETGAREEAIRIAEEALSRWRDFDGDPGLLAELHAHLGRALWIARKDKEGAAEHAWKAIRLDATNGIALWLVRELDGDKPKSSRHLRVEIQGEWSAAGDAAPSLKGFFRVYDVVADDPDEALAFIRRIEPEQVGASLRIERVEETDTGTAQPRGVYSMSGRIFFPAEG